MENATLLLPLIITGLAPLGIWWFRKTPNAREGVSFVAAALTFLFIGHDLAVIQQVSHDVLVMRAGEAVEHRPAAELFASPREEYTRALLDAVPPARPRV